jgi:hypothetical protein
MNPIIPFGPALLSRNFKNHWVYWVGPLVGGPLAVPVYKLLIHIKVKYGPKPMVPAADGCIKETAATREELIGLLNKLLKSQENNELSV